MKKYSLFIVAAVLLVIGFIPDPIPVLDEAIAILGAVSCSVAQVLKLRSSNR